MIEPRSVLVFDDQAGLPGIVQDGVAIAINYGLPHVSRQGLDDKAVSVVFDDVFSVQLLVMLMRYVQPVRVAMNVRAVRVKDRHATMLAPRAASRRHVILPFDLDNVPGVSVWPLCLNLQHRHRSFPIPDRSLVR